jgi:endonuclease-8
MLEQDLPRHPYLSRLGLDLLDPEVRPSRVRDRLREARFGRRSLGALLLDQSFLSGVGNYLRSEILHYAALSPARRPRDLDEAELLRLSRAAITVAQRAYRSRGVTIEPARARRLRAAGKPRRSYRHYVFGRAGEGCPRCGDVVVRRDVAGRRLYHCPTCQT